MLCPSLAQIRAWADAADAHLSHVALHRRPRNRHLLAQNHRDPPGTIIGMGRIDLINAMLGSDLLS